MKSKTLYHITTERKAKLYRQTGRIIAPVRGFTTMMGAMAWGLKIGSIKFHISSSLEYGHTISAQNIYTGIPVYNKRFKSIDEAMKSVEKTVDNEIEKHYNEINNLKQCKENITYISDKIVG